MVSGNVQTPYQALWPCKSCARNGKVGADTESPADWKVSDGCVQVPRSRVCGEIDFGTIPAEQHRHCCGKSLFKGSIECHVGWLEVDALGELARFRCTGLSFHAAVFPFD